MTTKTTKTTTPARLALKATTPAGDSPVHGCSWVLPTEQADGSWKPGAWNRVAGTIEYRRRGLHVCAPSQLAYWTGHLRGKIMTAWVCEYSGHVSVGKNGLAARRVRLLRPWTGEEI